MQHDYQNFCISETVIEKCLSHKIDLFHDRVSAVFLPATVLAHEPCPYRVEVVHSRSDERRVVFEKRI